MTDTRIKNKQDLDDLKIRLLKKEQQITARVLICMTGCRALGAAQLVAAFEKKIRENKLAKKVKVVSSGCLGQCSSAPLVLIEPYHHLYGQVKAEDIDEIIAASIKGKKPVKRLLTTADPAAPDFFKQQQRIVLENCGRIDPRSLDDAICHNSYTAACRALLEMEPEAVIEEVKEAGLRGRGGAGFPAGIKWGFCRQASGEQKYLICNADEGDPGAFMDRALLEGTPHQVIEGMIIAAYAIGASRGFIYVRIEYPIAVEHITLAIDQARAYGLLGRNILGSGFNFDIEVRMGAGAFVCGEETALIASLEGRRGMPRPRPPFPAVRGYLGQPTNINNVETLANIPAIITRGKDWYKAIGTETSKGTKIFALAGKVRETGLVEVPMGTTLRQLVFDIGGGIPDGRSFKAAQMGGPSGGCLPARFLDLPVDYESVKEAGAIMGSGGLIVMDDSTCIVDIARFFIEFVQQESCGKCVPCRTGTAQMLEILQAICAGRGNAGDIQKLEELGRAIKETSLCGLGQTAPNPVLSTLRHFRSEYDAHIGGRCPAGKCKALITYRITDSCTGCTRCARDCPVSAITGKPRSRHEINQALCTRCGTCETVCPVNAVETESNS